jgi:hypothetical protein
MFQQYFRHSANVCEAAQYGRPPERGATRAPRRRMNRGFALGPQRRNRRRARQVQDDRDVIVESMWAKGGPRTCATACQMCGSFLVPLGAQRGREHAESLVRKSL